MTLRNGIAVGIGGIIGALARYGLSLAFNPVDPAFFPWGTLLCNYAGCLLLGCFAFLADGRLPPIVKLGLTTGVIGAFTTFSTFSLEMLHLAQSGRSLLSLIYFLASGVGGLVFVQIGAYVAGIDNRRMTVKGEGRP